MKTIEPENFQNCYALKDIRWPMLLEEIGHHCFANCKSLEVLIFPASLKEITPTGENISIFPGCSSLKKIDLSKCTWRKKDWNAKILDSSPNFEIKLPQGIVNVISSIVPVYTPPVYSDINPPAYYRGIVTQEFTDYNHYQSIEGNGKIKPGLSEVAWHNEVRQMTGHFPRDLIVGYYVSGVGIIEPKHIDKAKGVSSSEIKDARAETEIVYPKLTCYFPASVRHLRSRFKDATLYFRGRNAPDISSPDVMPENCTIYIPKGSMTSYYSAFRTHLANLTINEY